MSDSDLPVAIDITWQPPDITNFQNVPNTIDVCNVAIAWEIAYINAEQDSSLISSSSDVLYDLNEIIPIVPADVVLDYLVTLFKLNVPVAEIPSNGTLLDFYMDQPYYVFAAMDSVTPDSCFTGSYICPALDWQGDSDVSGIGMIIAYYMVAIMTSAWFFAVVYGNFSKGRAMKRHRAVHAIIVGFQDSIHVFLDAALIFSISMVVAAITRYAEIVNDPTKHYQIYGLLGSIFMSTYSILPAIVLQTVIEVRKHLWLRLFLWFLLIPFAITLDAMYRTVYKSQNWVTGLVYDDNVPAYFNSGFGNSTREQGEIVWLEFCDPPGQRQRLEILLTVTHVFLAINALWWMYHLLLAALPRLWKEVIGQHFTDLRKFGRDYKVEKVLLALDGFACFVLMWFMVVLFHEYRNSVKNAAGDSNTDTDWTFGQVVAVSTWVPVFVDYATATFYDAEGKEDDTHEHAEKGGYTGVGQPSGESHAMLENTRKTDPLVQQNSFYRYDQTP